MEMKLQTLLSFCVYACVVILHCRGINLGSVDVVGSAECLDCVDKKETFSGMRVGIGCRKEGGVMKIRSRGKVDEEGRFRVPFSTTEGVVEEICSVVLHNGGGGGGGVSSQLCEAPPRGGSCKMVETMDEGRHEVHLLGKLSFSSSTCTSALFPWYTPKLGPWKKKKKPFLLIFPFPPKCITPFPIPTQPPPYLPPVCDNNPPPPSIVYTTPSPPTPVFLPTPPPAFKNPPIVLRPPPPAFKNPPIFFPPPSPVFKNPPIFLPPPPPEFKNPPIFLPPRPPEFKNPPIFLPPPPIPFKNPPIFETPFNPSAPPPPVMEFMPVPLIPKFIPPKFNKPCPPWFPPKNSGHTKFGFWFPVPP